MHALCCHCPSSYTFHADTDPSTQTSIFTTSHSTNCNTKPAGPLLIGFAVTDDINTNVTGSGCSLDPYPKWGSYYTSMKIEKIRGFFLHHLHWTIPTEKARQCTAINFGIVRRYCGVFNVWGCWYWYYLRWYLGEESTYYNFPFCCISIDVLLHEWMFRKGIYALIRM